MRSVPIPVRRFAFVLLLLAPSGLTADELSISPAHPERLSNSSLQFTAKLGGLDVTRSVWWASSNPNVATIAADGIARLAGAGTTTITANLPSYQASTDLMVTIASSPVFTVQPRDTGVNRVINPGSGVKVKLFNSLGEPLRNQAITIAIGANPSSISTLAGTLTQFTDSGGTASFPDLRIDWLGTGYTLVASANPVSGQVSAASAPFNELRVGDPCLGPGMAACSSGCADTDRDGLNDAWEIAGGIDLNGDGRITDASHDLLLPWADPRKPDIFVQYDWMDRAPPGNACTVDTDCTGLGLGHKGETCTGPQLTSSAPASCRFTCNADSDCTARGPSHAGESCQANACVHTHDPNITAPGALQAVVDRFAAHGINLHLIRGHAVPHSTVVSFRLLSDPALPDNVMTDTCEGASVASGNAGEGKYGESLYDLKKASALDKLDLAYHYALFSHYSGCDTAGHCNSGTCTQSQNPNGSPKNAVVAGESGLAEISGNDFVVSLASRVQDLGLPDGRFVTGGTFMHELGHNLGLHHGGGIETPCLDQSQCRLGFTCQIVGTPPVGKFCVGADDTGWKPNYLSVMNYRFQFSAIQSAAQPGSNQPLSCSTDANCPVGNLCYNHVCSRLDYSSQTLPTGGNSPGALDESISKGHVGLNEPAGLGSGTPDLTSFFNSRCDVPASIAATNGPVDWSGNGDFLETNVAADLNAVDHPCGTVFARLSGATDWPDLSGVNFNYQFQCTAFGGPSGDGAQSDAYPARSGRIHNLAGPELSTQTAMKAGLHLPIRSAKVLIRPGCANPAVAPGQPGVVTVAILGDATFDVTEVDPTSLSFAAAAPLNVVIRDVDGDGIPDLVMEIDMSKLKLGPRARAARVSGWLKNTQAFFGEARIRSVANMAAEDLSCR